MTASASRSTPTSTDRRCGCERTGPAGWCWSGVCTPSPTTGARRAPGPTRSSRPWPWPWPRGGTAPAPLSDLWDGLEVFAAYGEELEPRPLAIAAAAALGIEPDASGLVDHERIAAEWERTSGSVSIVADLFRQLKAPAGLDEGPRATPARARSGDRPGAGPSRSEPGRRRRPCASDLKGRDWAPGRGLGTSGIGRTLPIPERTPLGSPRNSGGRP